MTEENSKTPRRRLFKLQWSLQTMFLLTAVVAVWVPYFQLQKKIERSEIKIDSMRSMARELWISDMNKIAVVKKMENWYDENRWEIYLPDGDYTMRLATRKIDHMGFAPVVAETAVSGGRHTIELLHDKHKKGHEVTVTLNDKAVIEARESLDWDQGHGSSGGGLFIHCKQLSTNAPVVLFRRRWHYQLTSNSTGPRKGPTEGLLLWIERVTDTKGKSAEDGYGKITRPNPTPPAPPVQTP